MVELPKNRTGMIGLEARQFRKNAGPDKNADNSCWTDTPEEKLKKEQVLNYFYLHNMLNLNTRNIFFLIFKFLILK